MKIAAQLQKAGFFNAFHMLKLCVCELCNKHFNKKNMFYGACSEYDNFCRKPSYILSFLSKYCRAIIFLPLIEISWHVNVYCCNVRWVHGFFNLELSMNRISIEHYYCGKNVTLFLPLLSLRDLTTSPFAWLFSWSLKGLIIGLQWPLQKSSLEEFAKLNVVLQC